jgi:hypothetical protein
MPSEWHVPHRSGIAERATCPRKPLDFSMAVSSLAGFPPWQSAHVRPFSAWMSCAYRSVLICSRSSSSEWQSRQLFLTTCACAPAVMTKSDMQRYKSTLCRQRFTESSSKASLGHVSVNGHRDHVCDCQNANACQPPLANAAPLILSKWHQQQCRTGQPKRQDPEDLAIHEQHL